MIELDRTAPLPIGDQLVEALRYEIAAGQHLPGERLPSTRVLADQIGISFHTVRKAYQRLAEEGLLGVQRGGGYVVLERAVLTRAERLERASAVVEEALHRLVGLGLGDDELEYVVEEGLQFFERPGRRRTLLFVAGYRELADSGAEQATGALQERVAPFVLGELPEAADGVVVPLPDLAAVRISLPEADVVGVSVGYEPSTLERVARLGADGTLGILSRWPDATAPLTDALRRRAGFGGRVLALSLEADRRQIEATVRASDLVLYTPQARRRARPIVSAIGTPGEELAPQLSAASLSRIRTALAPS